MMKGAIAAVVVLLAVAVGVGRGALTTAENKVAPQDAAAEGSVPAKAGSTQKTSTQPSVACGTDDSSGDAQDRQDADPGDTPDPENASDAQDRQDGDPGNTPETGGTDP